MTYQPPTLPLGIDSETKPIFKQVAPTTLLMHAIKYVMQAHMEKTRAGQPRVYSQDLLLNSLFGLRNGQVFMHIAREVHSRLSNDYSVVRRTETVWNTGGRR